MAERWRQAIQARIAAGPEAGTVAFRPEEAKEWVERTTKGIAEWHTLLDNLDEQGEGHGMATGECRWGP